MRGLPPPAAAVRTAFVASGGDPDADPTGWIGVQAITRDNSAHGNMRDGKIIRGSAQLRCAGPALAGTSAPRGAHQASTSVLGLRKPERMA